MIPDWLDAAIERAKRGPYRADASEFIFGRGLTSPGLEDAQPSKGGRYPARNPASACDIRMGAYQSRLRAPGRWPGN